MEYDTKYIPTNIFYNGLAAYSESLFDFVILSLSLSFSL